MEVHPLETVKKGMILEQNIYRHDSLLAIPKGVVLQEKELEVLRYFTVEYVKVSPPNQQKERGWYKRWKKKKEEYYQTLAVIERSYLHCVLWRQDFGHDLFRLLSEYIRKHKKAIQYLNDLRKLDSYSFAQAINVSMVLASVLTKNQQYDKKVGLLIFFALMHNIGRVKYPNLFREEGRYTDEQYEQLQQVPYETFRKMSKLGFSPYDLKFILEVNEQWNGQGYPQRIRGKDIEEFAQYIHLANIYNALSSYRPHRGIFDPYDVLQILEEERNRKVGSAYIDVFLERFTPYKIGTKVELSNNQFAIVKTIPSSRKFLPVVQLIDAEKGEFTTLVDLGIQRDLRIRRIVAAY